MFYYPIPFALHHSPHCTSQLYILHLLYSTCTTHPLPVCLCLMQYAFQHQQWPKCDFDKVMIGERSNQHHFLLCKGGSTTAIATPTSPNQPRCPTLRTPSPPTQCSTLVDGRTIIPFLQFHSQPSLQKQPLRRWKCWLTARPSLPSPAVPSETPSVASTQTGQAKIRSG